MGDRLGNFSACTTGVMESHRFTLNNIGLPTLRTVAGPQHEELLKIALVEKDGLMDKAKKGGIEEVNKCGELFIPACMYQISRPLLCTDMHFPFMR